MASGLDAQVGIADEVTYGTLVAPTEYVEFTSESIKAEFERIESAGLKAGRRVLHRWTPGVSRVVGDVETELSSQAQLLLEHCFGNAVTVGDVTTYTPGSLDGKSLSVQVGRPDLSGVIHVFDYAGVKVTEWEISASTGEYAMLKTSLYGQSEATGGTLGTATYGDLPPFSFVDAFLTVGGVAVCVEEFTLSGSNNLGTDRYRMCGATGNDQPKEPLENGLREYTGSFIADFTSLDLYNAYVNGTESALVVTLGNGTDDLVFTMNVRFDGSTPEVSGPELLTQPIEFKATSTVDDATAITAVLTVNP